jgi:hypothetical protein
LGSLAQPSAWPSMTVNNCKRQKESLTAITEVSTTLFPFRQRSVQTRLVHP